MLTVYSTNGSPGASTTAMHLAAHWASTGREVLLIEADPAGGMLSHNLGIQFTPGSASFVASGLPVLSSHLIEHAQDVLFENLHVMPAPASPAGARGIFRTFADSAEDLWTISESDLAVIIDGGRITADTAASELTTRAAGVVVVCRNNSQFSSLEHLKDVLAAGPDDDGPQGCAVTIGKSPMEDEEWRASYGLAFCGTIELVADMTADLSPYLNRNKRKSKKWWHSLAQVGEKLYQYAQPPASDPSRRLRPAAQTPSPRTELAGDVDHGANQAATGSQLSHAQDPTDHGQPPMAPSEPMPGPASLMAPAAGADSGQPHYPHYLPPSPEPQPGLWQSHHLPPSAGPEGYVPYTPPAHEQPHPAYEQPHPSPGHEQPHPAYEQPQPSPGHEQPHPAYEQPQPGAFEAYGPAQQPTPAYEQPAAGLEPPSRAPSHERAPALSAEEWSAGAGQPVAAGVESGPKPDMEPTGSFREWAVKLHGANAGDTAAENRSGEGFGPAV